MPLPLEHLMQGDLGGLEPLGTTSILIPGRPNDIMLLTQVQLHVGEPFTPSGFEVERPRGPPSVPRPLHRRELPHASNWPLSGERGPHLAN
eukprot:7733852-Pyramimonas_sp.AAC.1